MIVSIKATWMPRNVQCSKRITFWSFVRSLLKSVVSILDRSTSLIDFRNLVERTGNRAGKCQIADQASGEPHTGTHRTRIQHVRNIQQRTISRAATALVHVLTQLISPLSIYSQGFFLFSSLFSRFAFLFSSRIRRIPFRRLVAPSRRHRYTNWRISGSPHAQRPGGGEGRADFFLSRFDGPISIGRIGARSISL